MFAALNVVRDDSRGGILAEEESWPREVKVLFVCLLVTITTSVEGIRNFGQYAVKGSRKESSCQLNSTQSPRPFWVI